MSRRSKHAFLALAVVAALCIGPALAEPTENDALPAARELVSVMRATDQMKQLLPSLMQMLKPVVAQGRPEVEHDLDTLMPVLSDGMNTRLSELTDEVATIYARNFSADEIRQMTAFYRTPVGQKFLDKMPAVAQESLKIGQAWGQRIAAELQTQMVDELRKRGHKL
jgi:hypothetical protein